MSLLTPAITTGKQFFDGTLGFRTSDDAADNFSNGVYAHLPIEWSATEANELKSLLMYMVSIFANGRVVPVRNVCGVTLPAGPVRVTGYDAVYNRFTIALASANANSAAQLLLLAPVASESTWQASHSYTNETIRPVAANGCRYVCIAGGTSGGAEPAWPATVGATVADGTVTWTCEDDTYAYAAGDFTGALDTTGANVGDPVYLSDSGGLTLSTYTQADKVVQEIGRVETQATNGVIAGNILPPMTLGASWLQAQAVTLAKLVRSSNAGAPLLGGGANADSAYGPLNLAGGANVVTGALPLTNGGTGATDQNDALNNLLPSQSGANGQVLGSNGTTASWVQVPGMGTLPIADGGTGATTAAGALSNLGAAASGSNSDITSLSGLTTALSLAQGGSGGAGVRAVKTSDTTRTSSTSITADPDLVAALAANSVYKFRAAISCVYGGASGNKFDVAWSFSGSGALQVNIARGGTFTDWAGRITSFPSSTQTVWIDGTQYDLYLVEGLIATTNAGNLSFNWTSHDGTGLTVAANSWLEAIKISGS